MNTYKPRRASKRWLDADCPQGVLAIFDNPNFCDRYTVFYREIYGGEGRKGYMFGRSASACPFHPQGIGQTIEMRPHEVSAYRYANSHRACRWSALPEDVKKCVRQDLKPEVDQ